MTEKMCAKLALEHKETPWIANKFFENSCFPRIIGIGPAGYGETVDSFGVKWIMRRGEPGPMPVNSNVEDCLIKDIANWRDYVTFPDLDKLDWQTAAEQDTARWDRENRLTTVDIFNGDLECLETWAGLEPTLCATITDEDAVKDFNDAHSDWVVKIVERVAKYYKPDKIVMHDDYANQRSLWISREQWQELYKPSLKKITDAVHGLGMYYEHHSCGRVAELFDDFVDVGVDATNPVQFINNPYELQKKYEDTLTLVGCSDKQAIVDNPDATPEQIDAHLRELVETMSKRRSYYADVFFLDPSLTPIWAKIIDEYNTPLYEKAGVKPRLMMDMLK